MEDDGMFTGTAEQVVVDPVRALDGIVLGLTGDPFLLNPGHVENICPANHFFEMIRLLKRYPSPGYLLLNRLQ